MSQLLPRMEQQRCWTTMQKCKLMMDFELTGKQECLQGETGCSAEVLPPPPRPALAGDATSPEHKPISYRYFCLSSQRVLMYTVQHKHFVSSKQFCLLKSLCCVWYMRITFIDYH